MFVYKCTCTCMPLDVIEILVYELLQFMGMEYLCMYLYVSISFVYLFALVGC